MKAKELDDGYTYKFSVTLTQLLKLVPGVQLVKRNEIVNSAIVAVEQKRGRFGSGHSLRDPFQTSLSISLPRRYSAFYFRIEFYYLSTYNRLINDFSELQGVGFDSLFCFPTFMT